MRETAVMLVHKRVQQQESIKQASVLSREYNKKASIVHHLILLPINVSLGRHQQIATVCSWGAALPFNESLYALQIEQNATTNQFHTHCRPNRDTLDKATTRLRLSEYATTQ